MTRDLITTTVFKKDMKRAKRRGKDRDKLKTVLEKLIKNEPLDIKYKAHKLSGNMAPFRECHIEPD